MDLIKEMVEHAAEFPREEVCGLIVSNGNRMRLLRGTNTLTNKLVSFEMGDEVWLAMDDDESEVAVYHSHVVTGPQPSMADLTMCEATGVPWHIITSEGAHSSFSPSGYRAPYEGRPYTYRIHDCFSILRDYHLWELGIQVPDFEREEQFWDKNQNLYVEGFPKAGFVVVDGEPVKGDVFLFKYASRITNHAAIYLGDGKMLHHAMGQLSRVVGYSPDWQAKTTHHLRHSDRTGK